MDNSSISDIVKKSILLLEKEGIISVGDTYALDAQTIILTKQKTIAKLNSGQEDQEALMSATYEIITKKCKRDLGYNDLMLMGNAFIILLEPDEDIARFEPAEYERLGFEYK